MDPQSNNQNKENIQINEMRGIKKKVKTNSTEKTETHQGVLWKLILPKIWEIQKKYKFLIEMTYQS